MRWFTILVMVAASISAFTFIENLAGKSFFQQRLLSGIVRQPGTLCVPKQKIFSSETQRPQPTHKVCRETVLGINSPVNPAPETELPATYMRKAKLVSLKQHATEAKSYTLSNHFNSRYCFLIDMKIPSGRKRFFMYDLENDSIIQSGLVTHGSGGNNPGDTIVFSNKPGSNCTSLGKYKIGKYYYGKFGLAYKLYGLDKTNSNAFNRFVVLHAHPLIPDNEINPRKICTSWGCPTVSPAFLHQLKSFIDPSEKPILLWIYK